MKDIQQRLKSDFKYIHAPDGSIEQALAHIEEYRDNEGISNKQSKKTRRLQVLIPSALAVAAIFALSFVGVKLLSTNYSPQNTISAQISSTSNEFVNSTSASNQVSTDAIQNNTIAAYVGIDINPSLEFELNSDGSVLNVVAFNLDAQNTLNEVSLVGLSYPNALNSLIDSGSFKQYLTSDAILDVQVVSDNQQLADSLTSITNETLKSVPCKSTCSKSTLEQHDKAHEMGMGLGRYLAAQELTSLDSSISIKDCANMSMREIRDAIDSHHAIDSQSNTLPYDSAINYNHANRRQDNKKSLHNNANHE